MEAGAGVPMARSQMTRLYSILASLGFDLLCIVLGLAWFVIFMLALDPPRWVGEALVRWVGCVNP